MIVFVLLAGCAVGVIATLGAVTVSESRRASQPIAAENTRDAPSTPSLAASQARADRLQAALDAMPYGVMVADQNGQVLLSNKAANSAGSDAHNEVLVQAAVQYNLRSALRGEARTQTVELYGPPKRVVVVEAHPLNPDGAMVTVEDVTERARLDAVRTDFVANISHELKTPIGALAVLAETLIDETDPTVISRLADRTVNEAHRVAKIIDDLLELSRIELSGDLIVSSCDVGLLVVEAASRNSLLARQNKVVVNAGEIPVGLSVNADHAQITSALGNLVDNAVKYSDANGVVNVTAHSDQQGVMFVVSDNGIGIPSRDLDRIFERFYRVDRARSRGTGGTGLGLSIVRHVANNHGGSITVESHEGEGSTFRLYIPDRLVPQT
ncbi:MAG: ATP-binding protein [Actinomycetota bacterium]|jgi:two-component system sensor histidine kinase SenX3